MGGIVKFGEDVEGYRVPVLNEREIRAAAGILFALMFAAIAAATLKGKFVLLKYAIAIFLPDMLIRVLVSPRYAPTLILGRLIVRNQVPEYVGARQKKFAWVIGVALASVMFVPGERAQHRQPNLRVHLPRLPGVPLLRDGLRHLHRLQALRARRPGEARVLPRRGVRGGGSAGNPADLAGAVPHPARAGAVRG